MGLPISLDAKLLLNNFIGDKNQQVLKAVQQLFSQKNSAVLFIAGESSSGKTHLLQGCTFAALEQELSAVYIDIKQELPEGLLSSLSAMDWVCIDNIEALNTVQQQELFDLYNQIKQTNTKLVVATNNLPNELDLLKDLKTRLSLAIVLTLEVLDDAQKINIIKTKMLDKNINIDDKIYAYLFKHLSRDLNDVLKAIEQLDQASLQQKNAISIPFVKQVLKI